MIDIKHEQAQTVPSCINHSDWLMTYADQQSVTYFVACIAQETNCSNFKSM